MKNDVYLIAGASGFIGGALFDFLDQQQLECRGIGRRPSSRAGYDVCDLTDTNRLQTVLQGTTCVINCSGYAHAFAANSSEKKAESWRGNYQNTKNLLEAAVAAGVKQFIQISSIKAMSPPGDTCVDETWPECPQSEYGKSKLAAEKLVLEFAQKSLIAAVILRPAMVFGPGSNGNLERMLRFIEKGIFPPLPETHNHRSMVYISDLVAAIMKSVNNSNANGQIFIVASNEAPSGRQIYLAIRSVLGLGKVEYVVPGFALKLLAAVCEVIQLFVGKRLPFNEEVLQRLLKSEWYCSSKIEKILGWNAKVSLNDGLQAILAHNEVRQMNRVNSRNSTKIRAK
jgi:UDP-glucose 4-epimerase